MKQHADGHWETTLELLPGRYEYKFVCDGEWIPDLLARENVLNQHGTLNSVIEVRPNDAGVHPLLPPADRPSGLYAASAEG